MHSMHQFELSSIFALMCSELTCFCLRFAPIRRESQLAARARDVEKLSKDLEAKTKTIADTEKRVKERWGLVQSGTDLFRVEQCYCSFSTRQLVICLLSMCCHQIVPKEALEALSACKQVCKFCLLHLLKMHVCLRNRGVLRSLPVLQWCL